MENVDTVKTAIELGDALFGTIDTWLIWILTCGVNGGLHVTDVTNASRTMLMNLKRLTGINLCLEYVGLSSMIQFMLIRYIIYSLMSVNILNSVPTLNEYRKYIEKDPALERRFHQVFCGHPFVEETISILRGLRERYEIHHGVTISDGALVSASILADRYITECFFLDKAIDLIDEAAAKLKMEIASKPVELDEIDRTIFKLEMEKESLKNDTDKASIERRHKLDKDPTSLKDKRKELHEQFGREKTLLTRIRLPG